jgi:hypothetical protein
VRCHSLQVKLRKRKSSRVHEELREAEYGMDVFVCESEQGMVLGEDGDEDTEERFLNNIVNYWTSSYQQGDMVDEASNEEPSIFYSDVLCMFADLIGDKQQLDDVLMNVDEEMRLIEEMDELEEFIVEHIFVDLEDNDETIVKREANENQLKTCNNHQDNEKKLVGEIFSAKEQDE